MLNTGIHCSAPMHSSLKLFKNVNPWLPWLQHVT